MATDTGSRSTRGDRPAGPHEVLLVEADPASGSAVANALAPAGIATTVVASHELALEYLASATFAAVIIGLDTPVPDAGLGFVEQARRASPTSLVVVLSRRRSFVAAVKALRAGAQDFVLEEANELAHLEHKVLAQVPGGAAGTGLGDDLRAAFEELLARLMDAERRALDGEERRASGETGAREHGQQGQDPEGEVVRALFVDSDDRLFTALSQPGVAPGFAFELAQSGGEALDRVTSSSFEIALVGRTLPDLPGSMVVKALKEQAPQMIVIAYELGGRLEIVEPSRVIPIVDKFSAATQLAERLSEVAEAQKEKGRQRRYLGAFRERHLDLLRRLAALRARMDRELPGSGQKR